MKLSAMLKQVAQLQPKWTSENTPEMEERGQLIRNAIPSELKISFERLQRAISPYGDELEVGGSDGIGNKTAAPWVRLFSRRLSKSATTGFYVVLHFSTDGAKCFFTLGTGTTSWNNERGDLIPDDLREIQQRTKWVVRTLQQSGADLVGFSDEIEIGSALQTPKLFEAGTAICRSVPTDDLNDGMAFDLLERLLSFLSIIYLAVDRRDHLPTSEALAIQSEADVSERNRRRSRGQGRGLNAAQRKAVELRAMAVVQQALESDGYAVKDTSANKPYDFLAKKEGKEVKVEVKGTTSSLCDAVQMTRNEVELHRCEMGSTALGIVSSIVLDESGDSICGKGGTLELSIPWDISGWHCEPATYLLKRILK